MKPTRRHLEMPQQFREGTELGRCPHRLPPVGQRRGKKYFCLSPARSPCGPRLAFCVLNRKRGKDNRQAAIELNGSRTSCASTTGREPADWIMQDRKDGLQRQVNAAKRQEGRRRASGARKGAVGIRYHAPASRRCLLRPRPRSIGPDLDVEPKPSASKRATIAQRARTVRTSSARELKRPMAERRAALKTRAHMCPQRPVGRCLVVEREKVDNEAHVSSARLDKWSNEGRNKNSIEHRGTSRIMEQLTHYALASVGRIRGRCIGRRVGPAH